MKAFSVSVVLVALATACFGADIRAGATMQVKANSIWFEEEAQLAYWQELKKSGKTAALAAYQKKALSEREAWQFLNPLSVKVLGYRSAKDRANVEMLTEGRMQGTTWWIEAGALVAPGQ